MTILEALQKCLDEGGWMRPQSVPVDPTGWTRPTLGVNQWIEPDGTGRRYLEVSPRDLLDEWEWRPEQASARTRL